MNQTKILDHDIISLVGLTEAQKDKLVIIENRFPSMNLFEFIHAKAEMMAPRSNSVLSRERETESTDFELYNGPPFLLIDNKKGQNNTGEES